MIALRADDQENARVIMARLSRVHRRTQGKAETFAVYFRA